MTGQQQQLSWFGADSFLVTQGNWDCEEGATGLRSKEKKGQEGQRPTEEPRSFLEALTLEAPLQLTLIHPEL